MSNTEIISQAMSLSGLWQKYEQEDLRSYAGWEAQGLRVKKGEKAVLKVDLWIPVKYKVKDVADNKVNEERRDGFRRRTTSLFHKSQVEPIK